MENEIDLKILIALHRVVNAVDSKTIKLVKSYGLSLGQFAVLEVLYHKGEMTVGQVQKKILSTTGTMPVIIKNLEKRKLISHKEDENDKRKRLLYITDKGRDIISQVFPKNKEIIIDYFKNMEIDEKKEFLRLMKSLNYKD
ncbi:MAG: MarR family transcriptional regulator [Candidatus Mucispirillum faecigallinarum]|nr:MarR family transcriptional regulator [Candidatus Mucispirillum faecigallinarum]